MFIWHIKLLNYFKKICYLDLYKKEEVEVLSYLIKYTSSTINKEICLELNLEVNSYNSKYIKVLDGMRDFVNDKQNKK